MLVNVNVGDPHNYVDILSAHAYMRRSQMYLSN